MRVLHAAKLQGSTVFVCHHGAGYSGLSSCVFCEGGGGDEQGGGCLSAECEEARQDAVQLQLHPPSALNIDTLVADFVAIVRNVFPSATGSSPPPPLVVGRSIGGVVVVAHASPLLQSVHQKSHLCCGRSALEALPQHATRVPTAGTRCKSPTRTCGEKRRGTGLGTAVEEIAGWRTGTRLETHRISSRRQATGVFCVGGLLVVPGVGVEASEGCRACARVVESAAE